MFFNKIKRQNISLLILLVNKIDVVREKSHCWLQELYKLFLRSSFYYVLLFLIYRSEYGIQQQESN